MSQTAPVPPRVAALEQRLRDLETLTQVSNQINRSLNLDQVLESSLSGIQSALGALFGCLALFDSDTHRLTLNRTNGLDAPRLQRLEQIIRDFQMTTPPIHDRLWLTLGLGQQFQTLLLEEKTVSSLLIPLVTTSQVSGILWFGIDSSHVLAPKSLDLLLSIGEQVGLAIENARLHMALAQSEQRYREFVENSLGGFWEGDNTGRILYVNQAACDLIGLDRDTLLQKRTDEIFVYDKATRDQLIKVLRTDGKASRPTGRIRTADGQIKIVSVTTTSTRDSAGNVLRYQALFHDVTEQTQLMDTLAQRNQELAMLNSIAEILSHPLEMDLALEQVCQKIATITGMETSSLYLLDDSRQYLNLLTHHGLSENLLRQVQRLGLDDPATYLTAIEGKSLAYDEVTEFPSPSSLAGPRAEGYLAGIAAPIVKRGVPVGAIFIGSKYKSRFVQPDIDLIQNVGRQIGVALDNSNLFNEMQQRAQEMSGLAALSAACARTLDPIEMARIAVDWTRQLLPVSICTLRLREDNTFPLAAKYSRHNHNVTLDPTLDLLTYFPSEFENQAPITIANVETEIKSAKDRDELIQNNARALAMMPMNIQERMIGMLGVAYSEPHTWKPNELELLSTIANQVSIALDNANQYAEMRQRVHELNGLLELSIQCSGILEPHALSQVAVNALHKLVPADYVIVRLLKDNNMRLSASYTPPGVQLREDMAVDSVFGPIVTNLIQLKIPDVESSDLPDPHRNGFLHNGIHAITVTPMKARDRVIGAMAIAYQIPHVWQTHEIDLLETIANQVANAIDSAQLFQDVLSEQRKVKAIFDSGLSGLFATDAVGRIVMFNHAAESITRYTLDQVQGHTWDELLSVDMPPLINEALLHKQTIFAQEGRKIRTKDGRVIPAAKAVAPLLDEYGTVTGAVGAFWDLTREQAAETERDDFLRMVAHQLRSPLTALLSALQMLERRNLSEARRGEMWQIVQSEGTRLRRFASQFLDLEKVIKAERLIDLQPLAISDMARALIEKLSATQPGRLINLQVADPEPLALADANHLEDVLRNLIDNALNHTTADIPVTVSIQSLDEKRVIVHVQDQGAGIPLSEQAKIFRPFYRSPREGRQSTYGHGLGLYIAKQLVKDMHGEIGVESMPGQGATFYFTLRRQ